MNCEELASTYNCWHEVIAKTSPVYARIDANFKENAESILLLLGLSPSSAIQMFYSRIVLESGLPFNLHLPSLKPENIRSMNQSELDATMEKGENTHLR